MIKSFTEKRIFFPYPNYGTRKLLFEYFTAMKGVTLKDSFPVTTIAHVTEGFTGGNVKSVFKIVIICKDLLFQYIKI